MAKVIGILDPTGINNNPLNNNQYSDKYKELAKKWTKLPAYKNAKEIINDIKKNQVLIVISGTGSGKTVLIPKYALHAFDYTGNIVVTLPKQLLTKSQAEYASATLDVSIGEHVGYKYKGSDRNGYSEQTKLLYATDGTVVQQLFRDPELRQYAAVVIDEAHERKVMIDLLLLLLKNVLKARPEFRLIIMSATINPAAFEKYYSDFKCKTLTLQGDSHYPIESIFLKEPIGRSEYIDKGLEIIVGLLEKYRTTEQEQSSTDPSSTEQKPLSKDMLFFISSQNEAIEFCKKLHDFKFVVSKPLCIEVFSGMQPRREFLATDANAYKTEDEGYNTKIVVATNVAESSLTIDGIKYVIDGGFEYSSRYDPVLRAKRLDQAHITRAQALQRMGRTGRTEPGVCYHLYTEAEFKKFKAFPDPDILTEDLSGEFLKLLQLPDIRKVDKLIKILNKMIDTPPKEYIESGIYDLKKLGLIDKDEITAKGDIIVRLQLTDIFLANTLFYSYFYKCSREMSIIISLIENSKNNLKSIFMIPKDRKKMSKYENSKNKFKHEYGDHLSLLNIMDEFNKNKNDANWCYDNFLKQEILKKTNRTSAMMRGALLRTMKENNIEPTKEHLLNIDKSSEKYNIFDDLDKIKIDEKIVYCIILGMRTKMGKLNGNAYDTKFITNVDISKDSFLWSKRDKPKNIIYTELLIQNNTNKELNIITKISDKFLIE